MLCIKSKPQISLSRRILPATRNMSTRAIPAHDWSAAQYLKFEDERTQPARDLLSRVPLQSPKKIVDLGCGPGNSTAVLETRYPSAQVVGMDSSPDMIRKAQATLPHIEFSVGDLNSYTPPESVDLFFSNAVFQWLGKDERINVIKRLMETQKSGGVFAFQVPDNLNEPSHILMGKVARDGPWASTLATVGRDAFQTPQELYGQLKSISSAVHLFHTSYYHSLENHEAIIQWVKGTGLKPYLDPLQPHEKENYLQEYLERLRKAYPSLVDGQVLLRYPRLFMVAVKK